MSAPRYALVQVGQAPTRAPAPTADPKETATEILRQITLPVIVGAIVTGAAFAIGGELVSRYLFRSRERR